jgi:hypothetical protein
MSFVSEPQSVSVLNKAPSRENIETRGDTAPPILTLSTKMDVSG